MTLRISENLTETSRRYFLFLRLRPYMGRYAFLILCILGLMAYAAYIRMLIVRVQSESVTVTEIYAELMRTAISENMDYGEMNSVFEAVIKKSNNPIIITNLNWQPLMWRNIAGGSFFNHHPLLPGDSSAATARRLASKIKEFRKYYTPKPLYISGTQTKIGYLVFGNSPLVSSLRWVPLWGVGVVVAFLVFAWLAFRTVRVTERSNLWVALAKETAHQLGTPISSLMGWVELMKAEAEEACVGVFHDELCERISSICVDMDRDLNRLQKITARFSQIGSLPTLSLTNVNQVLEEAKAYLSIRLPMLRRHIRIETSFGQLPPVALNRELMGWVFENLMKNSIDAIRSENGVISISTEYIECDNIIRIYHSDNGKGISWEDQKRIFSPGFTTKKRGWGLGLTLAKRIVDEYHKGRIYVLRSQKEKGTTFAIELPVSTS
jgi:signal transduction histidine kinase